MTPVTENRTQIPTPAWAAAAVLFVLAFLCMSVVLGAHHMRPEPRMILPVLVAIFLAGYALLVGYIYSDAKRRGMRYVMWTWLAILVPNAIGIILYFILRDPVPVYCSTCRCALLPNFAFCPRCGSGQSPVCGRCSRPGQIGWTHCAYCGSKL